MPRSPATTLLPTGTGTSSTGLVRIERHGEDLTPAQEMFNRLVAQVGGLRAELDQWEQFSQRFDARLAAVEPALAADIGTAMREVLAVIDGLLGQAQRPPLRQREQRILTRTLLSVVRTLLQEHPEDEALVQWHDLHSRQAWGASGDSPPGAAGVPRDEDDEDSADAIEARLAADAEQREEQRRQRAAQRRQARARVVEQAAAQGIRQSVRGVFRQLVGVLHPDREADPTLRAHKTALMQRVNLAHADNDLLGLLALQLEIAQIGQGDLAALPNARLQPYLEVLQAQVRTLQDELHGWLRDFRARCHAPGLHTRKQAERHLEAWLDDRRAQLRQWQQISAGLRAPRLRQATIAHLDAQARLDDEDERAAQAEAAADLDGRLAAARARGPRRSGRPRS